MDNVLSHAIVRQLLGGEVTAPFERWLAAAFDHVVGKPEWYWDEDFAAHWESLGLTDQTTVTYLTTLFRNPGVLSPYLLEQVAQGIWFLVGDASPAQATYALLRLEVPLMERIACVRSIPDFFRSFVGPAAPNAIDAERDPFHAACYMWWDIFPIRGGPRGPESELQQACLQAMEECLALPSGLCQLSALHGLNHWQRQYPGQVEEVIDTFLAREGEVSATIRSYALGAREGCLQ
jgi:hypothetical protein